MVIDRRSLLAGAGAALALNLADRAAAALERSEALFLAPAGRADGSFAVMVFGENAELIREIGLPSRGHDLAIHRPHGRAVAFARRPGTFALAFDIAGRAEPRVFLARPDRHFYGHGAYSADGKLLFATENDFEAAVGVVGIYDATDGYRRIGEFPTHGIGTHEAILLPDGKTLAIANGGIATHPDFGRTALNRLSMDPSLSFVDVEGGQLLAQHRLPQELRELSIRHMTVDRNGAIWFGTQWEGDPLQSPALVGRASMERGLELVSTPKRELIGMRQYVGAMATSTDGTVICASAPRGGVIAYWSAESGRYLGKTAIADSSGIAGASPTTFLASNGEGRVVEAGAAIESRNAVNLPGIAFDNHLRVLGSACRKAR